jgi:hypothetical protein
MASLVLTAATLGGTTAITPTDQSGAITLTLPSTTGTLALAGASSSSISNGTSNVTVNSSGGTVSIATAGTTALTVSTAQNVGIGTSSPTTLVDLVRSSTSGSDVSMPNVFVRNTSATQGNGSSTFNQSVVVVSAGNGTVFGGIRAAYDSAGSYGTGMQLYANSTNPLQFYTNGAEKMRLTSGGALGVGTTSPSGQFEVSSAGYTNATFSSSGAGYYGQFTCSSYTGGGTPVTVSLISDGGSGFGRISTGTGHPLVFGTVATERMRLTTLGLLIIGNTASPGTNTIGVQLSSDMVNYANVISAGTYTSTFNLIAFYNGNGNVGGIQSSGSSTLYNTTSDRRLKTNIVDAPLGNIDNIKVRSFDWIADGAHQEYGLIAQELIEIAPYAVSNIPDSDQMMGVDYSKLVPMMIKEIQTLKERIAILENK